MSQVAQKGVGPITMDPYEIGWYIESADEEIYGPVSRKTLRRFLEEKTITPNTLVRHCTQPEARPAADQPVIMEQLSLDAKGSAIGDKLAEAWPRKKRDRQALAEDSLPCAWHKRPAVLVCVRCHAPYCDKCRAKPFRKQFFLCRRCQAGMYNRRFVALILDSLVLVYVPIIVAACRCWRCWDERRRLGPLIIYLVQFARHLPPFLPRLALWRRRARQASHGLAGRAVEGRKDAAHLRPGNRALAQPVYSDFQSG